MKTSLLLALLAGLLYYHFQSSTPPTPAVEKSISAPPARPAAAGQAVIIASAPSSYNRWACSYERWKTGPNAQTDLKTGPNAQTDFEPFAPSEQAAWNQTPGYTIVSGRTPRVN